MGNSLRCCLACVIPCGSLDLIRVVHINGQVDEYSRPMEASQVLADHPRHVLTTPTSHRILLVSPDSLLRRGRIYFLVPDSSLPCASKNKKNTRRMAHHPKEQVREGQDRPSPAPEKKGKITSRRVGAWRPHLHRIHEDE